MSTHPSDSPSGIPNINRRLGTTELTLAPVAAALSVFVVGAVIAFLIPDRSSDEADRFDRNDRARTTNSIASPSAFPVPSPSTKSPSPSQPGEALRWAFQLPSGNIACVLDGTVGKGHVSCEILEHSYDHSASAPPSCAPDSIDRFILVAGNPTTLVCDSLPAIDSTGFPVLHYDQRLTSGSITCVASAESGITCTDGSSSHFFRLSREGYAIE